MSNIKNNANVNNSSVKKTITLIVLKHQNSKKNNNIDHINYHIMFLICDRPTNLNHRQTLIGWAMMCHHCHCYYFCCHYCCYYYQCHYYIDAIVTVLKCDFMIRNKSFLINMVILLCCYDNLTLVKRICVLFAAQMFKNKIVYESCFDHKICLCEVYYIHFKTVQAVKYELKPMTIKIKFIQNN